MKQISAKQAAPGAGGRERAEVPGPAVGRPGRADGGSSRLESRRRWPSPRSTAPCRPSVVDGQENTWSNIYGQKFFEVQDGITETNHGIIDYLVVVSTEWWDGLSNDVRGQLQTGILDEVTETAEQAEASTRVNEDAKQGGDRRRRASRCAPWTRRSRDQAWVEGA